MNTNACEIHIVDNAYCQRKDYAYILPALSANSLTNKHQQLTENAILNVKLKQIDKLIIIGSRPQGPFIWLRN